MTQGSAPASDQTVSNAQNELGPRRCVRPGRPTAGRHGKRVARGDAGEEGTHELTDLGLSLRQLMRGLKTWAEAHMDDVLANRATYDTRIG